MNNANANIGRCRAYSQLMWRRAVPLLLSTYFHCLSFVFAPFTLYIELYSPWHGSNIRKNKYKEMQYKKSKTYRKQINFDTCTMGAHKTTTDEKPEASTHNSAVNQTDNVFCASWPWPQNKWVSRTHFWNISTSSLMILRQFFRYRVEKQTDRHSNKQNTNAAWHRIHPTTVGEGNYVAF